MLSLLLRRENVMVSGSTDPSLSGAESRNQSALLPGWLATLAMPVWVTGPDGCINFINRHAEKWLGRPRTQCLGRPCYAVIASTTRAGEAFCSPNCRVRSMARAGRELEPVRLNIMDAAMENAEVRVVVIPVRDSHGDGPYLVHCIIDDERDQRVRRYLDRVARRTAKATVPATVTDANLTPREKEVLQLLAKDRSLSEIADELYVSYATVRNHVQHILEKMGVHSIQETVALFLLLDE
jgi:DNA-binding CsgD family transcriptional regulator